MNGLERPKHRSALNVAEMRGIVQQMLRSHVDWLRATDVIFAPISPGMQPNWNDMVLANQLRRNGHQQTEILSNAIHKFIMMGDMWSTGVRPLWDLEAVAWRWVAKALAEGEFDCAVELYQNYAVPLDDAAIAHLKNALRPAGVQLDLIEDARGKRQLYVHLDVHGTGRRAP